MLPINPARLPALFNEAVAHIKAGRLAKAKELLTTVLTVRPDNAAAQFQMAIVTEALGDTDKAAGHFDRALDLKPTEPAIWQRYAVCLEKLGDPARSEALLDRARRVGVAAPLLTALEDRLAPAPAKSKASLGGAPAQEVQQAIGHLLAGRPKEALAIAGRLRKAHPKVAILADIAASAQAALGQNAAAEASYRQAIKLDPGYAETRANFGRFLLQNGRHSEAEKMLASALKLLPDLPAALSAMGKLQMALHNYPAAVQHLRRVVALDPRNMLARLELADALLSARKPDEVAAVLRPLQGAAVPGCQDKVLLGRAMTAMGENDRAAEVLDAAMAEAPEASAPVVEKAYLLQLLGDFDGAEALYRRALEIDPRNGQVYQVFLVTKKLGRDDPLIPRMEALFDDPALSDRDRTFLGFALGKVMEDTGQHGRVFDYLRPANASVNRASGYDVKAHKRLVAGYMRLFADVEFSAQRTDNKSEFAPIFVTGLPRSGTTLVEQIIASHSQVGGGGELGIAHREMSTAIGAPSLHDAGMPLSDDRLAGIGRAIEAGMRAAVPGAERITDKGVQSYLLAGPIFAALPKARFVIVNRDPRDNALSMYKNLFAPGRHLYSYDLKDIAAYFRCFREIVAFWRERMPERLYEIQYEDLIADPEGETRRLIAACGLDWEDACLSFHENKRRVDTLSVHQVRQPIYASSKQAWRRYESELGELFEALGPDYAPERA